MRLFVTILPFLLTVSAMGQVAGNPPYILEQAVIASGGGTSASGGFSVTGTIGQPAADRSSGPQFSIRGGFWNDAPLAPSAATASVGGRVRTASGQGIRNVTVILTESDGTVRNSLTGPFGYYSFDEVVAGQTVFIGVRAKRFTFSEPTRVVNVSDDLTGLDFVADDRPPGEKARR